MRSMRIRRRGVLRKGKPEGVPGALRFPALAPEKRRENGHGASVIRQLLQGLKPMVNEVALFGTTEVMPCYKAWQS